MTLYNSACDERSFQHYRAVQLEARSELPFAVFRCCDGSCDFPSLAGLLAVVEARYGVGPC